MAFLLNLVYFRRSLHGFDLFPILEHFARGCSVDVSENVGMPSYHFRVNGFDHIGDRKFSRFLRQHRMENYLQEQIAQLFAQRVVAVVLDGLGDFKRLFN